MNLIMKLWTEVKIYLSRANSYLIILNTGALLFLMLDKVKSYGINIPLSWYILISMLGFALLIIIGRIDSSSGLFEYESKRASDRNPYLTETLQNTKEILARLNK